MPSNPVNTTFNLLTCPTALRERIEAEIPKLEGWCSPERCVEMALLVIRYQLRNYVEIGVFGGRSLIAVAMAMEHADTVFRKGSGVAHGIDPWSTAAALEGVQEQANREWWAKLDIHGIHRGCMEAIWRNKLEHRACIIRNEAQHCAHLFGKMSLDMLYIDGNHSEEASTRDVKLWKDKVEPGGFIIFDDADWTSTSKALELLSSGTTLYKDGGSYRIYRKRYVHPNSQQRAEQQDAKYLSKIEDIEWKKTHPESE